MPSAVPPKMGKNKKANISDNNSEEEYLVEKVIDKRMVNGEVEYFIKWKDYSDADNTWESEDNLHCPDLVEEFEINRPEKKKAAASSKDKEKKATWASTSSMGSDVSQAKSEKKKKKVPTQQEVAQHFQHMQHVSPLPMMSSSSIVSSTGSAASQVSTSSAQQDVGHEAMRPPNSCIRHGCPNAAISDDQWENEYCSNECAVSHCRDVFLSWMASNGNQL